MTSTTSNSMREVEDRLTPDRLIERCDLMTPYCVRALVTLGLTKDLTQGPTSAEELSSTHGLHVGATRSLLDYLAERDIVLRGPGGYELAEAAKVLDEPGRRLGLDMNGIAGRMDDASLGLPEMLTTGRSAFEAHFGASFWQFLRAEPRYGAEFDASLDNMAQAYSPDVVKAIDWTGIKHVADIAGGLGTLAASITDVDSRMRVTLVESVEVAARAKSHLADRGAERVSVETADMFADRLPAADAYVLCQVIHDWPDREASRLLRNIVQSAPPTGARVLVIDRVTFEGTHGAVTTFMDLRMRILFGAGERSEDQLRHLLDENGISVDSVTPSAAGLSVLDGWIHDDA